MNPVDPLNLLIPAAAACGAIAWQVRRRNLHRWLPSYVARAARAARPARPGAVHVILCIADHFEPKFGSPPQNVASGRVLDWAERYPRLFGEFRDSDGRPPRHTFFYPIEEYEAEHLDALAGLCRSGFGEVEVHLHHDGDNADDLRRSLLNFVGLLDARHGLLARDPETGRPAYGFIHGNWALDNSRPDGRWCGVNNELDVLRETGCYADFTLPSAPDPSQTRKINSIYYAVDDPDRPKSHDRGVDVGSAPAPPGSLLLIQGPLVLDWSRPRWGLIPRIENGCIQASQPATIGRLGAWLKARVQVPTRPDWFFVKLHTHGAPEANRRVLLGEPMVRFHQALADLARANPDLHYHYVSAREMYNLVCAAEAGWAGTPSGARDFRLVWEPRSPGRAPGPAGRATPQPH